MRFAEKVVIVTGGGGGIGSAACMAFAKEGARVVISDDSKTRGESCLSEIERAGGTAIFVLTDVSVASDVEQMVAVAEKTYGGVDILFNNNGLKRFGSVTETDESDWDYVMNTNLKGMYLCAKSCIPIMLRSGGGVIINNGFVNLQTASPRLAAYTASKAGIIGLTKSICADYGRRGIRINCISPNFIETPMMTEVISEFSLTEKEIKSGWASQLAAARLGTPKDVANLVLFLASDQSSFIQGSVITINGGSAANTALSPESVIRPGE